MMISTTALAAAGGYCRSAISLAIANTTLLLWLPLMILTTKKSPITSAITKIEPSAMPVLDSGMTIVVRIAGRSLRRRAPPR